MSKCLRFSVRQSVRILTILSFNPPSTYPEMLVDDFDGVVFDVEMRGDSALIGGGEISIGLVESHHLCLHIKRGGCD